MEAAIRHSREGALDLSAEEMLQSLDGIPSEDVGMPTSTKKVDSVPLPTDPDSQNVPESVARFQSRRMFEYTHQDKVTPPVTTESTQDYGDKNVHDLRRNDPPSPQMLQTHSLTVGAMSTPDPPTIARIAGTTVPSPKANLGLEYERRGPVGSPQVPQKPAAVQQRSSTYGGPALLSKARSSGGSSSQGGFMHNNEQSGKDGFTKNNTEDGFKSIRNKAKGMFSRIFTPSRNEQLAPSASVKQSVSRSSSAVLVPNATIRSDLVTTSSFTRPSVSQGTEWSDRSTIHADTLRPSRRPEHGTAGASKEPLDESRDMPMNLPLPSSTSPPVEISGLGPTHFPRRESSMSSAGASSAPADDRSAKVVRSPSIPDHTMASRTITRHVREGALSQVDVIGDEDSDILSKTSGQAQEPVIEGLPSIDSSPERFRQWRQAMEGMLEGKGIEQDIHRELGISATSLSSFAKGSAETSTVTSTVTPAMLDCRQTQKFTERGTVAGHSIAEDITDAALWPIDKRDLILASSLQAPLRSDSQTSGNGPRSSTPSLGLRTGARNDQIPDIQSCIGSNLKEQSIHEGAEVRGSKSSFNTGKSRPLPNELDELDLYGKTLAAEMFDGDESHVQRERVAEYLGGLKPLSKYALKHYMAYFDFANLRLADAFRLLCGKLYLKAETQEIDRILEAFSERYFLCNPGTIFGSSGVIHTVTGSFLLLNTDLHIADIATHMSRAQFIRLTLETINANQGAVSPMSSASELPFGPANLLSPEAGSTNEPAPTCIETQSVFANAQTPVRTKEEDRRAYLGANYCPAPISATDSKDRITSSPSMGSMVSIRGHEHGLEAALREIYTSVKNSQILLPVEAPFEFSNMRRGSGVQLDRRRTSFRGIAGIFHPASAEINGQLRSQTISTAELPALGFASNLAQTVIKEQVDETTSLRSDKTMGSEDELTDDQLALMGAPWAKEGNLSRKLYWDAARKRSKDKQWKQVFAVLQKGEIHMFTFGAGVEVQPGNPVGGGNWMTNAQGTGDFNLSHAIATSLPPPGYNTARPYCFSLTFPTGELHFFQTGTEELIQEWVATCNYWAARRSRPPLPGGVTNAEYGWRVLESSRDDRDDTVSVFSNKSSKSRISFQNTIGRRNNSLMPISDWQAPQPSLIPSPLDEEAQLESLRRHLDILAKELKQHESFEDALNRLYPPRSNSLLKAKDNWRSKSFYIRSEIDKYTVYVDALQHAIALRVEKQGEKKLHQSLQFGSAYDSNEDDDDDNDIDDDLPYEEG